MQYEIKQSEGKVTFNYFDASQHGMVDKEVSISQINKFGIDNREIKRRDGYIKSWDRRGRLDVTEEDGIRAYWVDLELIKELKILLKGKYSTEKYNVSKMKKTRWGMSERTAVDWAYTIIRPVA